LKKIMVLLIFKMICWYYSPVSWRLSCGIIDQHNVSLLPRDNLGLLNKVDFFTVPADLGIQSRLNAPASRQTWLFLCLIPLSLTIFQPETFCEIIIIFLLLSSQTKKVYPLLLVITISKLRNIPGDSMRKTFP
jgi:hypothetical protein